MVVLIIFFVFIVTAGIFISAVYIPPIHISDNTTMSDSITKLDDWLEKLHSDGKFNGSVLLAKGDEIIFSKSYTYEDIEENKLVSESSSFNLASVSKQFTAMGVVLLKHQGKVTYEDRMTKFIPELKGYDEVTIQQLLHHTSGIPDYISLANKHWREPGVFKTSDMISLLTKYNPPLKFSSGSKFEYSNTGYVLLAEIIARISRQPFSQFMSDNIFQPLGMDNTQVFNLVLIHKYAFISLFGLFYC